MEACECKASLPLESMRTEPRADQSRSSDRTACTNRSGQEKYAEWLASRLRLQFFSEQDCCASQAIRSARSCASEMPA